MASEALPPCPFAPRKTRGAHDLAFVIPNSAKYAVLMACTRCGMGTHHSMDLPRPLDDLSAEAIRQLARPQAGRNP